MNVDFTADPGGNGVARKGLRLDGWCLLALGLAAVWRLARLGEAPLTGDEAYYWLWSRHLDFSYYDHPAGVALLIRLSTWLGGEREIGIRWLNAALGIGVVGWTYAIAKRIYDRPSAVFAAALVALGAPYLMASRFACTDALQLSLLLFNLWLLLPWLNDGKQPTWRYVAQGSSMALLLNTQYDAYLYAIAMLALILWRQRRHLAILVRDPRVWTGLAIACCSALPMLIWNSAHGWASFRWQMSPFTQGALYRATWAGAIANILDYISPPLLLMAGLGILRVRESQSRALLWPSLILVLPTMLNPANSPRNISGGLVLLLIPGASLVHAWASRLTASQEKGSAVWRAGVRSLLLLAISVGIVVVAGALGRAALLHTRGLPIDRPNLLDLEAWGALSYLAVVVIWFLLALVLRALQSPQANRADLRAVGATVGWILPALCIIITGLYGLGAVLETAADHRSRAEMTIRQAFPHNRAANAIYRDVAGWRELDDEILSTSHALFAVDYSLVGQLSYYTHRPVYTSWSQFRLWPIPPLDPALILARNDLPLGVITARLQELFAQVEGPMNASSGDAPIYYWRVQGLKADVSTLQDRLDYAAIAALE